MTCDVLPRRRAERAGARTVGTQTARWFAGCIAAVATACGGSYAPSPSAPSQAGPDQALVAEAIEYWSSVLGITVQSSASSAIPRILIRSGTDGLGTVADARGVVDGTDSDNWAISGLIVIRPGVANRRVYRHEMGHALGFLGHSDSGLMAPGGPDVLSERERAMMLALYSLRSGARVEPDGMWEGLDGQVGKLDDEQAARDIIEFNMNSEGGSSFRRLGVTCRWMAPVRVFVLAQ